MLLSHPLESDGLLADEDVEESEIAQVAAELPVIERGIHVQHEDLRSAPIEPR